MNKVNVNYLKKIGFLGRGSYGFVTLVEYNGKKYALKEFQTFFVDKGISLRLEGLTNLNFSKEYLVPLYIVVNDNGESIGYLTSYDKNLVNIQNKFSLQEKKEFLKSIRMAIERLHNDYKYVHGDVHLGNIMYNRKDLSTSLIDFDLSINFGDVPKYFSDYKEVVQDYLSFYKFDEKVDVYLFNMACLHMLSKKEYFDDYFLLEDIEKDSFQMEDDLMNKDIKRLAKELLLYNTRQPYSGEFLIDYLR